MIRDIVAKAIETATKLVTAAPPAPRPRDPFYDDAARRAAVNRRSRRGARPWIERREEWLR